MLCINQISPRVALVEQELITLPEHLRSLPVCSGVRVTRSFVLCVCFVDRFCPFVPFLSTIVFSVLLRFTDSNYPLWNLQSLLRLRFIDLNTLIVSDIW